ncbi:MAG: hypothetical protein V3T44_08275 [bacterium]
MSLTAMGRATNKHWLPFLVPGLYQLRHKSLGEGLVFIIAAFLPLPLAWWLSPFFLIPSVIAFVGNFQEVRYGLPPDPPDWA